MAAVIGCSSPLTIQVRLEGDGSGHPVAHRCTLSIWAWRSPARDRCSGVLMPCEMLAGEQVMDREHRRPDHTLGHDRHPGLGVVRVDIDDDDDVSSDDCFG